MLGKLKIKGNTDRKVKIVIINRAIKIKNKNIHIFNIDVKFVTVY